MSLTKLMRFVSGDPKEWHKDPFSVKIKRATWSAATDGTLMFAFKKKLKVEPVSKDCPEEILLQLLSHEPSSSTSLLTAQLKEWAGKAPRKRPVKGKDVYVEDCGVLLGVSVDRRQLAYLLAKVNIPTMYAWVTNERTVVFEPPNGQWRAFVCGFNGKPDPEEVVFDPKPTSSVGSASAMDLMSEVEDE